MPVSRIPRKNFGVISEDNSLSWVSIYSPWEYPGLIKVHAGYLECGYTSLINQDVYNSPGRCHSKGDQTLAKPNYQFEKRQKELEKKKKKEKKSQRKQEKDTVQPTREGG